MLVIAVKPGERVYFDDEETGRKLWLSVSYKNGSEINLTVEAPREVRIQREELWRRHKSKDGS